MFYWFYFIPISVRSTCVRTVSELSGFASYFSFHNSAFLVDEAVEAQKYFSSDHKVPLATPLDINFDKQKKVTKPNIVGLPNFSRMPLRKKQKF